jgi:hypothetical protein
MTFYHESLTNLIAYGELRTNVFHEFSQIGNAIVFSLFLEQALVSQFSFYKYFSYVALLLQWLAVVVVVVFVVATATAAAVVVVAAAELFVFCEYLKLKLNKRAL